MGNIPIKPIPNAPQEQMVDVTQEIHRIMAGTKAPNIVKHIGTVNEAMVDGKMMYRKEMIYIPSFEMMVKCAPTDNHFIFLDSRRLGWTTFCTCGSPAVITGYDAYKQLGSNDGALLVCYYQVASENHRHADGSQ